MLIKVSIMFALSFWSFWLFVSAYSQPLINFALGCWTPRVRGSPVFCVCWLLGWLPRMLPTFRLGLLAREKPLLDPGWLLGWLLGGLAASPSEWLVAWAVWARVAALGAAGWAGSSRWHVLGCWLVVAGLEV